MKKFWLVLANEYKRHVLRKRFIFALLSFPLMVAFVLLISILSERTNYDSRPVGFIDSYHFLTTVDQVPAEQSKLLPPVKVIKYADESSAASALNQGQIQAYFMLSENYLSNGSVTQVTLSTPSNNASSDFGHFMTYNLASNLPAAVAARLVEGKNLIIRSLDGTREMNANNWISIILPILSGLLFIIAINVSGGYILQAVVEEKENRTMEILVTSVSPTQLMAGKIAGDLLVGLTELFFWILFAVIGVMVAPRFLPLNQVIDIRFTDILLLVSTFLPASILVSGLMGAVGAMTTDAREAQQISTIFTLPMMIPFWFVTAIILNPNGAISVALSLFPLTAPIALPMRAVFTTIPAWQIIFTLGLLWILAVFSLWLAGRVFRIGMLRYGKRLSLREVFHHA